MARDARDRALEALVRTRGPELVRYAYVFAGDLAAAQDLVQEALIKVFARQRAGLEPAVLEAYVRRAIASTYLDGYRRSRTSQRVRHLTARPETSAGPDVHSPDRLDLHAALAALGRQERTAVVLRYFDDLSIAQVADVMGVAEGSVKRYVSNAVRRLEQRLGPVDPAVESDHEGITVLARATDERS